MDADYVKMKPADVSLQKYITKVNETNVSASRANQYANTDLESNNHKHHTVKKVEANGADITGKTTYKYDETVKIEYGDKVTYRIYVYNNSTDVKANDILIKDAMPYYMDGQTVKSYVTIDSIYKDEVKTDIKNSWELDNVEGNNNTYTYTISELAPGGSVCFDITLKYDKKFCSETLTNQAWISSVQEGNLKTYRTIDRDYVKMKEYSVSLEKYVTQVTDKGQSKESEENYTDRVNHPVYNQNNYSKETHPVRLEVGDIVTYTIKLTNTDKESDKTNIKVTEIIDTFDDNDNANLTYIEGSATGYGTISVTNTDGGFKITISGAPEIGPNTSRYLTLKFKVEVPDDNTDTEQLLKNTAEVTQIKNKYDKVVPDCDGKTNDIDSDWVKTKTYAVSLEKYVYSVNGKTTNNRSGKAEYNDNTNNKFNYPETVKNGDVVRYAIKVTNDGNTNVTFTNITDDLPDGVSYKGENFAGGTYCTTEFGSGETNNTRTINGSNVAENTVIAGQNKEYYIDVNVTEPNISLNKLKNVAEIVSMKNRNDVVVKDTTPGNNKDADYIVLDYQEEDVSYAVEKVWSPNSPKTAQVTVKLFKKQGTTETDLGLPSVVLSENNNWKSEWKELPKLSSGSYVVRELDGSSNVINHNAEWNNGDDKIKTTYQDNADITINGSTIKGTKITNTYKDIPEKTTFTVVKNWVGSETEQVTVRLYKVEGTSGTAINDSEVTLSEGNWSHTWENLDKFDSDGNLIEYTAKEIVKDGTKPVMGTEKYDENTKTKYDEIENGVIITNERKTENTEYTVVKEWIGERSDSVKVRLYKVEGNTETFVSGTEVTLSNDKWSHKWTGLEKGTTYIAREINSNGDIVKDSVKYDQNVTTTYNKMKNGVLITNKIETKTVSYTVSKAWIGTSEDVKVRLYKVVEGRESYTNKEVTLTADKKWTHTWTNLDSVDSNGKQIKYVAKELNKSGAPIENNGTYDTNVTTTYNETTTGMLITNKRDVGKTTYTVHKEWVGNRADTVTVKLYKNGAVEGTQDLSAANNWTYTWENLEPGYDYTVKEMQKGTNTPVEGNTKYDTGVETTYKPITNGMIITNSEDPITVEVKYKVTKKWEGTPAQQVEVRLYKVVGNTEVYTNKKVILTAEDKWTHTWPGLEKGVKYVAREVSPSGEIVKYPVKYNQNTITEYEFKDGETVITNKPATSTTYTVTKKWVGIDSKEIKVRLYKVDGSTETSTGKEATLNEENGWTHTWTGLTSGDTYIARELNSSDKPIKEGVGGYSANTITEYKKESNGVVITNKIGKTPTTYTVTKNWEGNPEAVTVRLYKVEGNKEKYIDGSEVVLNATRNWTYTWSNLEEDVTYIARELNKSGNKVVKNKTLYDTGIETIYNTPKKNEMIITNKDKTPIIPETTTYTVIKEWAGIAASSDIKVRLYKVEGDTETYTGKEVTLNVTNNWTHTWEELAKGVEYVARELNSSNQPVKDSVVYNENTITNYVETESGMLIINRNKIPETVSYTVIKEWVGMNPEEITVRLYKEGQDTHIGEVKLNSSNGWVYTWTGLEKGIKYVAKEMNKAGNSLVEGNTKYLYYVKTDYTPIADGMKIRNTKTPTTTQFTVEKVWDDHSDDTRPPMVKVGLYTVSGTDVKLYDNKTVELSGANWNYTWTDLPKYDNSGNPIVYIAKEMNGKSAINEGEKYTNNKTEYIVHYLNTVDKTTITNKCTNPPPPTETDDLIISGIVWNDLALDKINKIYDGIKNAQESGLSGIKVLLYRGSISEDKCVATTYTDENGRYNFTNDSLDDSKLSVEKRYIKAPKVIVDGKVTNTWSQTYYSYYIEFEYDGITYTSTKVNDTKNCLGVYNTEYNDSNAKENEDTRRDFNSDFSTIGKGTLIYSTVNEDGYIPQLIHKHASNTAIKSSTQKIEFDNTTAREEQLKHVNLGLKGRNTFDLELTSDVYSTKVTVNGVDGGYSYNDNKVTVRRDDISNNHYSYLEDTANGHKDGMSYVGESYNQKVRGTDINVEVGKEGRATNYSSTGLEIEVTYKMTVRNTSNTLGTATKITSYFDKAYKAENNSDVSAYYYIGDSKVALSTENVQSGTKYNSVVITTQGTMLDRDVNNGEMYIYVVYKLNNAAGTLQQLLDGTKTFIPTLNMAEITEYKTQARSGEDEFTRGLIDKDSAPGSLETENEKVMLAPNVIGNVSTLDYYFGNNDLSKLKYEDDTYATPTIYFTVTVPDPTTDDDDPPTGENEERTLRGIVFEDKTQVNPTTRIKTGNGKLDAGEVGVYGATVELIEADGNVTRYITHTDLYGNFEFKNFLPGSYYIKYTYGNTPETLLLHQGIGSINGQSYNGEDYQSTNNQYLIEGMDTNVLNSTPNYWYAFNETEGISTARDYMSQRETVSETVTNFKNLEMSTLNNIRDLVGEYSEENNGTLTANKKYNLDKTELIDIPTTTITNLKDMMDKTYMYAYTEIMMLTVEETIIEDGEPKQRDEVGPYLIENMNFGIAEIPVTTIDLQKEIQSFVITDATGEKVLASASKDSEGRWQVENASNVKVADGMNKIPIELEDQKLQGSRLEITYKIITDMEIEKDYTGSGETTPTIKGIVDFIDNNLTFNENLGDNKKYWEVTTQAETILEFEKMKVSEDSEVPKSLLDPDGTIYSTVVKAKPENPILLTDTGTGVATITLEKILSSDSTFEEIVTSTVEAYVYGNSVEITWLDYTNTNANDIVYRDRVRTPKRYIILPGVQYDYATAETLTIIPPTGDTSISTTYYVIALIGLVILAGGTFAIKKFVVKK